MGKVIHYYCDKCGAELEKVFLLTLMRYRISHGQKKGIDEYTLLLPNLHEYYGQSFKKIRMQLCQNCIEKLAELMNIKLFENKYSKKREDE